MDFIGFLSMVIYVVSLLYTQCLRYNICSAWFLDIRISTCFNCSCLVINPTRNERFIVNVTIAIKELAVLIRC